MLNTVTDNINEELDNYVPRHNSAKCKFKVIIPSCDSLISNFKKPKSIFLCKKCDMKFKSKTLLQKHNKITHKDKNEAIICDICGKIFNKSSTLKVHLSCHKEKQCPYCFKILKSHSHFNVHLRNHKQQLKRKRIVKYHLCVHCDYRSLNKNSLEAHMNKVHLNIRPFVCDICQKGFYKKSNLTQHYVTHTKVKDKTCEICGDTFVNEKTLIEHLMLHSGQKPFKCKICNAEFITSGRRLEHMKRKHMEKAECCVICDKKFSLRKDLNSHLKNVHHAENYILKLDNVQTDAQVFKVMNCM